MLDSPELNENTVANVQEHDQTSAAVSVQSSRTSISIEQTFHLALVKELERKRMTFHDMS